jgi:multidrug efflux pump subunit AcrA (membrane-fusion protein)
MDIRSNQVFNASSKSSEHRGPSVPFCETEQQTVFHGLTISRYRQPPVSGDSRQSPPSTPAWRAERKRRQILRRRNLGTQLLRGEVPSRRTSHSRRPNLLGVSAESGSSLADARFMAMTLTHEAKRAEPVLEVVRRSTARAPERVPARSKTRRWTPLLVSLGLLVGCGAGIAIGLASAARSRRVASVLPPACTHALVARGPIKGVLRATAPLAFREVTRVGAMAPAQVVSVKVAVGDRVKRGQPLAQLDDLEQQMAMVGAAGQVATAELADVRAERELISALESQYGRPELPEDWSADEILEGPAGDAQIAHFHTGAQLAKQQALLGLTQRQVARRLIRAPVDGRIVARSVANGESISASPPGPPLFVIASDPAVLRIRAEIDATYVSRVRPGPASFRVPAAGDRWFPATVIGVAPANASAESATIYEVTLDARNEEGRLIPGMPAFVSLPMESPAGVLQVPSRAVTRDAGLPAVIVSEKRGTLRTVPVRLGITDDSSAEIEGAGINAGDLVLADAEACAIDRQASAAAARNNEKGGTP